MITQRGVIKLKKISLLLILLLISCSNVSYHAPSQNQISHFLKNRSGETSLLTKSFSNYTLVIFETDSNIGLHSLSSDPSNHLIISTSSTNKNDTITTLFNKVDSYMAIVINDPKLLKNSKSMSINFDNSKEIVQQIDPQQRAYLIDNIDKHTNSYILKFFDSNNKIIHEH